MEFIRAKLFTPVPIAFNVWCHKRYSFSLLTIVKVNSHGTCIHITSILHPIFFLTGTKQATEVEETLKRIQSHRGVTGILIVDLNGVVIKSNMSGDEAKEHAALISQLASKASSMVRTLDAQNDLTFLRIRTRKYEIMVAPDKEYILIVIQNPDKEYD